MSYEQKNTAPATVDFVQAQIAACQPLAVGAPLVWRGLASQEGTDDPVAVPLENTLGGTPVFARSTTGTYTITLTGAFLVDTVIFHGNSSSLETVTGGRTSDNVVTFKNVDSGSPSDDWTNMSISILVYLA